MVLLATALAAVGAMLRLLVLAPAVASRLRLLVNDRRVWHAIVIAAAGYVAYVLLVLFPRVAIVSPDSGSYLGFSPIRSIGYPVFLRLVHALTGSLAGLTGVQLALYLGAVFYLYQSTACLCRRPPVAGVLALALLFYGPALFAMTGLLSEPLYIVAILLCVAATFHALARPSRTLPLYVLAASAALVVLVRPAGYFAPAAVAFLALVWTDGRRRVLLHAIVPMIALLGLSMAGSQWVRGTATQSIGGLALFPYVAHLFEAGLAPTEDRAAAVAIEGAVAAYRTELTAQPDWRTRYLYSANNFNTVLGQVGTAAAAHPPSDGRVRDVNGWLLQLAINTIRAHPRGYLEQAARNVIGGWTSCIFAEYWPLPVVMAEAYQLSAASSRLAVPAAGIDLAPYDYQQLVSQHPVLKRTRLPLIDGTITRLARHRLLLYAIGALSALVIPLVLARRTLSPEWVALAFVSAMLHGAVLMTAAVTVFIPRYALPIDPLVICALVLLGDRLWARLRDGPPRSAPG